MVLLETHDLKSAIVACREKSIRLQKKVYVVKCTGLSCKVSKCSEGCYILIDAQSLKEKTIGKVEYDSTKD